MVGRIGSLLGLAGLLAFLLGIFGAPRSLAIAGVIMMVASFVSFFIEESGNRRAAAASE